MNTIIQFEKDGPWVLSLDGQKFLEFSSKREAVQEAEKRKLDFGVVDDYQSLEGTFYLRDHKVSRREPWHVRVRRLLAKCFS